MADQEDDDLEMALKMSMQHLPPEPKRSKPRDAVAGASGSVSSPEDSRRSQRELLAAAAEKRLLAARSSSPPAAKSLSSTGVNKQKEDWRVDSESSGRQLSLEEANQLFTVVFGNEVSENILARWTNQGIRFSPDPETSMGLVQHEGGPCGVLAAIQAFVLKYILFFRNELSMDSLCRSQLWSQKQLSQSKYVASDDFSSVADDVKTRALIRSMYEILLLCGGEKKVVIVTMGVICESTESEKDLKDETITEALEGISIVSASALHALMKFNTYTSQVSALQRLEAMIPVFRSRLGAMLFLFSALLSRGLDLIQADRDDPSLPLVTSPFGHASQEIVNLLLCGEAVPNVFDGKMDLGGGMSLKGVARNVEVGFLTLLESLNFCKVGQYLKRPTWPIWVVGSESHYTVLFALDSRVQDESELEERESQIRKAFDAQDQSGGGGFISVDGFHQVLRETNIQLPPEKLDHLCSAGFIVWSEFWQVILDLDKTMGGLKDSSGLMGKKMFDLYHFNGIAKSDLNCSQASSGGETPMQRPRLTKLRVSVPPKWTPEEFMAEVSSTAAVSESSSVASQTTTAPEPPQHAPLVDCIRTRWPRAVCNWIGDSPSIV